MMAIPEDQGQSERLAARGRAVLLLAVFISSLPLAGIAREGEGFDWEMARLGAKDYVPLDKVAEFYKLEATRQADHTLVSMRDAESSQFRIEAGIDSRQVLLDGVKHWLGYPVIEHEGRAMVSRIDLAKTIEPSLRPRKVSGLQPVDTVVLDAGHGGRDKGATNGAISEKDINLSVCVAAREMLEQKGFRVVLTRSDDAFVPLMERARIANEEENAIFVSVHFNYSPNGSDANGFEVFAMTPQGTPSTGESGLKSSHLKLYPGNGWDNENIVLANCVQHAVLGSMPQFDRGVKRARFAVLRHTRMPAILVEGAFLSNEKDTEMASCANWRSSLAYAITAGAVEYRKLAGERLSPNVLAEYREPPATGLAGGPTIQINAP